MLGIRVFAGRPLPPAAGREGMLDPRLAGGWPLAFLLGILFSGFSWLLWGLRGGLSALAGWALAALDLHLALGVVPRSRSRRVLAGFAVGGFVVRGLLFSLGSWLLLARARVAPLAFAAGVAVGVVGSLAPAALRAARGVGFELWSREG